jgi:signal transduction histidine kinase
MPARIRITIFFSVLVAIILSLVGVSVYYFSWSLRIQTVKTRLTSRAITTGRLLSQPDIFSIELIERIDSSTSMIYTNKVIQVYDHKNNKIYAYSQRPEDSIEISAKRLNEARAEGSIFFNTGKKDAVAWHDVNDSAGFVIIAAGEDREGKRSLKHLINILLLSFLGGLVITALSGYFFSKGLLKPVRKIADAINEISAQNFALKINTGKANDEWRYLSDTINALLNRLKESFDMQRRFISNASHELSTPLTSISNQIEVVLQREREAAEYLKVMKSVQEDVLHMGRLTRTLLEFAKASGTAGGIEIAPIRIDEVLLRLPAEMSKLKYTCSVSFEFNDMPAEENKLLVNGNEELLFTAIKNIVINACKYSDEPAVVKLGTETEKIKIVVQDNGNGIPKAELDHVFEPFYRVNDGKIKDGFGLGLSMARKIIKLHNGEIEVDSDTGKGSTFTIMLPVAKGN